MCCCSCCCHSLFVFVVIVVVAVVVVSVVCCCCCYCCSCRRCCCCCCKDPKQRRTARLPCRRVSPPLLLLCLTAPFLLLSPFFSPPFGPLYPYVARPPWVRVPALFPHLWVGSTPTHRLSAVRACAVFLIVLASSGCAYCRVNQSVV